MENLVKVDGRLYCITWEIRRPINWAARAEHQCRETRGEQAADALAAWLEASNHHGATI